MLLRSPRPLLERWLAVAALCAILCAALAAHSTSADAAQFPLAAMPEIEPPPPPPPDYPEPRAWTPRPLCELSNNAQALLYRTPGRTGVAVADLADGQLWVGGDDQTFALHSVAKAPIAWLAMAAAESRGEPLSRNLAEQMRQMIAWSNNDAVPILLGYAGGLPALRDFYAALSLDGLVANFHEFSWGRTRGSAVDVAAAYAQLATSDALSPAIRERGLALLDAVVPEQRWGAAFPPAQLRGWSALVKTGQFAEPGEGLRLNSAAIWLDQWRRPRYVVAIMGAEQRHWGLSIERQNLIGAALSAAIAARERNAQNPNTTCAPTIAAPPSAIFRN